MNTVIERISPMPEKTFNWLGINHTSIDAEGDFTPYGGSPVGALPDGVTAQTVCSAGCFSPVPSTLREVADFVQENCNHRLHLTVGAGRAIEGPIVLDYLLEDEGSALINHLHISAEPGSSASVILRYHSRGAGPHFHCGHVSLDVGEDSRLSLTQIQTLGDGDIHGDAIQAEVRAGGRLHLLLGELGGRQAVGGASVGLTGRGAEAELDSLYAAAGDHSRELNYRIVYHGEDTRGDITARGALGDAAQKVLKSTIDFRRGARGARGREEESVLVLSDRVKNRSAPLLLCGEDDVEGQHATNIGRPDQNKLYYLMTRGLEERAAKALLIEASFTPLLDKVDDPEIRRELLSHIREVTGIGQ